MLIGLGEAGAMQYGWQPVLAITGPAPLLRFHPRAALWRWNVIVHGLGSRDDYLVDLRFELVDDPPEPLHPLDFQPRGDRVYRAYTRWEARGWEERRAFLSLAELEVVAWERERFPRQPWRARPRLYERPRVLAVTR